MPHLHQDERDDRNQEKSGETEKEYAVYREHSSREHHQECENREHVVIAFLVN